MINRITPLLLFIGCLFGQYNGQVTLKNGISYKGEITEVNKSYVYILRSGMNNPQGIPVGTITNSVLDDGTLIVENGIVIKNIQDNQLIVPEIEVSTLTEELDFDESDCYMNGVIQAKADFKKKDL